MKLMTLVATLCRFCLRHEAGGQLAWPSHRLCSLPLLFHARAPLTGFHSINKQVLSHWPIGSIRIVFVGYLYTAKKISSSEYQYSRTIQADAISDDIDVLPSFSIDDANPLSFFIPCIALSLDRQRFAGLTHLRLISLRFFLFIYQCTMLSYHVLS